MNHILRVPDPQTDPIESDQTCGCGWKLIKNYVRDKTHLTSDPTVAQGSFDTETTLYCHCATHEYCPVKILLEYIENLSDGINNMKHKFGQTDGAAAS